MKNLKDIRNKAKSLLEEQARLSSELQQLYAGLDEPEDSSVNNGQSEKNNGNLDKQAYTVAEAAKLMQPPVSPVTIYRLIYAGKLKMLSGLGRMLIPRSELQRFFGRIVSYEEKMQPRRKRRRESKKYGA